MYVGLMMCVMGSPMATHMMWVVIGVMFTRLMDWKYNTHSNSQSEASHNFGLLGGGVWRYSSKEGSLMAAVGIVLFPPQITNTTITMFCL